MTKLEQAARALLAHWDTPAWKYLKPTGDLMADLREALAEQAEQEPVAWAHPSGGHLSARYMKEFATGLEKETHTIPLYAAPVQQAEQEPKELVPVLAGFDRSKYTKEQWDWCLEYLSITDYEPMMCDFEYGTHTFYEAVQASVQWYEDHTSDMHLKISRTVGKFDPEKEVDYD